MSANDNKNSRVPYYLVPILFFGGLAIGFFSALLLPPPFTGKYYEFLIVSVIMFLWGGMGLVIFIRQELRQFVITIRGRLAMFYGFIMMFVFWPLGLIFLVRAFKVLLLGD